MDKNIKESAKTLTIMTEIKGDTADLLCRIISEAVKIEFPQVSLENHKIKLEHPANENYGDYSTNIAFILSGVLRKKPMGIAGGIQKQLEIYIKKHQRTSIISDSLSENTVRNDGKNILEYVDVVQPGFINLHLQKGYIITLINRLLENENGSVATKIKTKKIGLGLAKRQIIVEFTDPNPFKELHIGHVYSNSVGESLSRLFEECGATVRRANYFGDVGMHVAKSLWGMMQKMARENIALIDLEKQSLSERIAFLGKAYALGATEYEENQASKEEMKDINYMVYITAQEYMKNKFGWTPQVDYKQFVKMDQKLFSRVEELFRKGREWSMAYFETIYKKLGTKFDYYYPESIVGEYGMELVKENLKKGIFEKHEGAVVYRGEKEGLHTRVFINSLGLPTYEAKELGLAPAKYKDFSYDFSLIVTGKEINEYFQVLISALNKINPKLGKKTVHLGHGMVRLPEGKMSSRTGKILTGEWMLSEVKEKILKILNQTDSKYGNSEQEDIAQKAAVAAVKYSLLRVSLPSDIAFDIEKSVSFEGESGPYLMYTYARCKSVLRKSKIPALPAGRQMTNFKSNNHQQTTTNNKLNSEELSLLRTLYRLPEIIGEAARTFSPNLLCSYLFDLAQKYNFFYNKHTILNSNNKEPFAADTAQGKSTTHPASAGSSLWLNNSQPASPASPRDEPTDGPTTQFRLFLTAATAVVLKKGLFLLGIETVERM
ncbi:arginine--tRNA ligase [Patescibacteria group bacterium]|nr:arginine--tRNA ligase [Patescibacteria group bacterium]